MRSIMHPTFAHGPLFEPFRFLGLAGGAFLWVLVGVAEGAGCPGAPLDDHEETQTPEEATDDGHNSDVDWKPIRTEVLCLMTGDYEGSVSSGIPIGVGVGFL